MTSSHRLIVALAAFAIPTARADEGPSFEREVRPILAAKCFACHGPDEEAREGELRLDEREAAVAAGAITPGKPRASELVARVLADDPDVRMPPPDSGDTLSPAEKRILQRWIATGAEYTPHWAFQPPRRPRVPRTPWPDRLRNPIDAFVFATLEREGLTPSPEADRYTLARRVSLDLVGLPPTPEEADAFVADDDPRAYEKYVDRLLASPHYGERWARDWLDLARYADTNGYEKDRPRSIWPYRDWVVRALNADMPYDRFTIEQLAGDMLPNATVEQRIATGFHRNTMLNEEGGIDPNEYRFHAMVDRTATTGTVWLGLTVGCAQCHTHKYDPITHTDYYRFLALLNNASEPDLSVPDPAIVARRKAIDDGIAQLEADLPSRFPPARGEGTEAERRARKLDQSFRAWVDRERTKAVDWTVVRPTSATSNLPRLDVLTDGSVFSRGDITKRDVFDLTFSLNDVTESVTALRLEVLPDDRLPAGGPGRAFYEGRKGDFFLSEVTATVDGEPVRFRTASHDFGKISIGNGGAKATNVIDGNGSTGWGTAGREGQRSQLVLVPAEPLPVTAKTLKVELLFERHFAASLGRFRFSCTTRNGGATASSLPADVEALLAVDPKRWSDADRATVRQHFLRVCPELAEARKPIDQLRRQRPTLPHTMTMAERRADNVRPTHRHHRGEYLSPRELVAPGVPDVFAVEGVSEPTNRLELARWLVSEQNPLAARVAVNRAWQAFFGIGLVESAEDFGTQAAPPSHPALLDWLATEYVASGWSTKRLHRLIVTSAAYRQSSHVSPELAKRDPRNRLLSRGPRFRMPGELVRDASLRSSGLLTPRMYGPGVRPPQPAGVTALAYGSPAWRATIGPDRNRRSLYTFQKRTAPFAAYTVFDAPTGESCIARRNRSNTPLQALTLLNDAMYLELSRALARSAHAAHRDSPRDTATAIFRRVLTRPPGENEIASLLSFQRAQRARFERGELNAIVIAGDPAANTELAAWAMVARVVMNLDEAITKP